jgi:hypothetical protein
MVLALIAALSAAAAGMFLGLRAQMLKPHLSSWPDAPLCVRYSTFGLSAVLGGYTVAVINGYQPSSGEAVILSSLALYSGLLWLNLYRQVRAHGA